MNKEILLASARKAYEEGNLEMALNILGDEKLQENSEAIFIMGEVFYKLQKWGDSLNCFNKVLEIEKDNDGALTYVNMIKNILNFYHKELYNP